MDPIQVLIDTEAIRNVEARYARYADAKRWTDLAGLFTADGTFVSLNVDGTPLVDMKDRTDIADTLNAHNSGDVTPLHQLMTSEIEITSPTTARAIWSMSDIVHRGDSEITADDAEGTIPSFRVMRGWGHYHVTYVKADGVWQIATRRQTRTRLEFSN